MKRFSRQSILFFSLLLLSVFGLQRCGWLGDIGIKGGRDNASTMGDGDLTGGDDEFVPPTTTEDPSLVVMAPNPVLVGSCFPVTVAATRYGVAWPVVGALSVEISSIFNQVGFYGDSGCSQPIVDTSIAAGSSSQAFWVKAMGPGYFAINAKDATIAYADGSIVTQAINSVDNNIPVRIIVAGPSLAMAGDCVGYAMFFANANDYPTSFTSASTVNLSSIGTGSFYSDDTCSGATISSIGIPAAANSGFFYYKGTNPSFDSVIADANGLHGEVSILIIAGMPVKLSISGPTTLVGGQCGLFEASALDQYDNVSVVPQATTVDLSVTGAGQFYGDSNCVGSIQNRVIPAQNSKTRFYFMSDTQGDKQLLAAGSGLTDGTLDVEVITSVIGDPAKLAFSGPAGGTTAGSCFGPFKLEVQDTQGRVVSGTTATANLSDTGQARYYDSSICNNEVTSVAANDEFYVRDFQVENTVLHAEATGQSLATATYPLNVSEGVRYKLRLLASSANLKAGDCQPLMVVSADPYNNPVAVSTALPLYLFAVTDVPGSTAKYYSDASCSSAFAVPTGGIAQMTMLEQGLFQENFFFRETKAGLGIWRVADTKVNSGMLGYNVSPGAPTKAILVRNPVPINQGQCAGPFRFRLYDQYNNIAPAISIFTVALAATDGGYFSDSQCGSSITSLSVAANSSRGDVYFKTDGNSDVTGTLDFPDPIADIPLNIPVAPTGPTRVVIGRVGVMTDNGTALAGECVAFSIATVNSQGEGQAVASDMQVILARTPKGTFYANSACTTGTSSVIVQAGSQRGFFYFKDTVSGATTLAASANNLFGNVYVLTINAGPASTIRLTGPSPSTTTAGICTGPFQVRGVDPFGNLTGLVPGTIIGLAGLNQGQFFSGNTCSAAISSLTIQAPAVSGAFYLKETVAGALTLQASHTTMGLASLAFTITTNVAHHFTFHGAWSAETNQCSTQLQFRVVDEFGNNIRDMANERVFQVSQNGTVKFYNANCMAEIDTVKIPKIKAISNPIYFRGPAVQVVKLLVSDGGPLVGERELRIIDPPIPTVHIAAAPIPISNGEATTVTWSSSDAISCEVKKNGQEFANSLTGSRSSGGLVRTTPFVITCTGRTGLTASAQAVVTVNCSGQRIWLNNPFTLRGFVNTQEGEKVIADVATQTLDVSAPKYTQETAQRICHLAGFPVVKHMGCNAHPNWNRCGWASTRDNDLTYWNGSRWVAQDSRAAGNKWLADLICGCDGAAYTSNIIHCASGRYRYAECAGKGGAIKGIEVVRRVSVSGCRFGRSYGIKSRDPTKMWVHHGCRANFKLTYH